jgi:hypothetical protein
MPCADTEKLIDLAYGEAPPDEAAAIEAHLAGCDSCRRTWEEIAGNIELLDRAADEPLSAPAIDPTRIFAAAGRRENARARRWRRAAICATAAVVVLATAAAAFRRVEIHATHVVIRWSNPPRSEIQAPSPANDLSQLRAELSQARRRLDDYGRRLEDLDRLASLVVSELKEDDARLTRATAGLHLRIDALQRQNDRRWQAVGRGFHDWYLANAADSAVQEQTTFSTPE